MSKRSFIARQHAKYYWKSLRTVTGFYDETLTEDNPDKFWDYEPLPRVN